MQSLNRNKRAITTLKMILFLGVCVFLAVALFWSARAQAEVGSKTTINPSTVIFSSQGKVDTSTRGRAPEPSSMVLMGSGLVAALVRFARRRFEEFKRGFDIAVASLGLLISGPVLFLSALIVRIDSRGAAFFKQTRVGQDGKIFEIWKLRTMVCDAESQTGPVWATENDPRVTSVGKFLRKSHIDEIPQLVNVLRGEMSIIGPRPERPEFVEDLSRKICDYDKRLAVKPGITGLAQIKQSYDSTLKDVRRKVKLDLLYIKKMCFLTDFRILLGTISVVLTGKGAR